MALDVTKRLLLNFSFPQKTETIVSFCKGLLPVLSSDNDGNREAAVYIMEILSRRISDPATLSTVEELLLGAFTAKGASPKAKIALAETFSNLLHSRLADSDHFIKVLLPLISKEANELVLQKLATGIGIALEGNPQISTSLNDWILNAVKSPKSGVRAAAYLMLLPLAKTEFFAPLSKNLVLSTKKLLSTCSTVETHFECAIALGVITSWMEASGDGEDLSGIEVNLKAGGLFTEKSMQSLHRFAQYCLANWAIRMAAESSSLAQIAARIVVWVLTDPSSFAAPRILIANALRNRSLILSSDFFSFIVKEMAEKSSDSSNRVHMLLQVLAAGQMERLTSLFIGGIEEPFIDQWMESWKRASGAFDNEKVIQYLNYRLSNDSKISGHFAHATASVFPLELVKAASPILLELFDQITKIEETPRSAQASQETGKVKIGQKNASKAPSSSKPTPTFESLSSIAAKKMERICSLLVQSVNSQDASVQAEFDASLRQYIPRDLFRRALKAYRETPSSALASFLYLLSRGFVLPIGRRCALIISLLLHSNPEHLNRDWNVDSFAVMSSMVLSLINAHLHVPVATDDLVLVVLAVETILSAQNSNDSEFSEEALRSLDRIIGDTFLPTDVRLGLLKAICGAKGSQELSLSIVEDLCSPKVLSQSNDEASISSVELLLLSKWLLDPNQNTRVLGLAALTAWSDASASAAQMIRQDHLLPILIHILSHDDGMECDDEEKLIGEQFDSLVAGAAPMEKATVLLVRLYGNDNTMALSPIEHLPGLLPLLCGKLSQSSEQLDEEAAFEKPLGFLSRGASECVGGIFSHAEGKSRMTVLNGLFSYYQSLWDKRQPEQPFLRAKIPDATIYGRKMIGETIRILSADLFNKDLAVKELSSALLEFLLRAFYDDSPEVGEALLDAAQAFLEAAMASPEAERVIEPIIGRLEAFLASPPPSSISNSKVDKRDLIAAHDRVCVNVVIMLGSLGRYIPTEARRSSLIERLMGTLSSPAESVQQAVADALMPLFAQLDRSNLPIARLIQDILGTAGSMAVRRGAAYGLASAIKAHGLVILASGNLYRQVFADPLSGSNIPEAKLGALFATELTARRMGSLFEPFAIRLLPLLLSCLADGRTDVRQATRDASEACLAHLSATAVRMVLPQVLASLREESGAVWRAKVGALEWLGAMASMAPRVLLPQLPVILPPLISSLTDSHVQVQQTARASLARYTRVVRSPEVAGLLPHLLEALADPPGKTSKCLDRILTTRFAHLIDGPSLALLEPVLSRALSDRAAGGAEVRKRAAQIVANLATSLVDVPDFTSLLPRLVPALLACLHDPVPTVRAQVAKVLGILVRRIIVEDGRSSQLLEGISPRLIKEVLESSSEDISAVDRAGAAQAVAEMTAARGSEQIGQLIQTFVLSGLVSGLGSTREAYALVSGYIPGAFDPYGEISELCTVGHLPSLLPPLLSLQGDDCETIREQASRSSRILVDRIGLVDPLCIFDRLVEALGEEKWRVRLVGLQLLQGFLLAIAGRSGSDVVEDAAEQEELAATEDSSALVLPNAEELIRKGGLDRDRLRSLQSRLFLARFDPANSQIRQTALTLWKALAVHPFRTLADIMPTMMRTICQLLCQTNEEDTIDDDDDEDQAEERHQSLPWREMSVRAIEDVLFKLGDRLVLPMVQELTGLCEGSMARGSLDCLAIIARCSGNPAVPYGSSAGTVDALVKAMVGALREAKMLSKVDGLFTALTNTLRRSFPDLLVPALEQILRGQRGPALVRFVRAQPSLVLPIVLPMMIREENNEEALEAIIKAAGIHTAPHVASIVEALMKKDKTKGEAIIVAAFESLEAAIASTSAANNDLHEQYQQSASIASAELGLSQLLERMLSGSVEDCSGAYRLVRLRCVSSESSSRLISTWLGRLLAAAVAKTPANLDGSADEALLGVTAILERQSEEDGLDDILQVTCTSICEIDTFDVERLKGLLPVLIRTVLVPAILQPSPPPERSRLVSTLIGRLVKMSPTGWPTASLVQLTGALIRVCSDRGVRMPPHQYLESLLVMLEGMGVGMRAFFPQLQRLFSQILVTTNSTKGRLLETPTSWTIARRAMLVLLPLLPRPEAVLQEWLGFLVGVDGEAEGSSVRRRIYVIETISAVLGANDPAFARRWVSPAVGPMLTGALKQSLLVDPETGVREAAVELVRTAALLAGEEDDGWFGAPLDEIQDFIKTVI